MCTWNGDARLLRAFLAQHHETVRAVLLSSDPAIRELADGVVAAPWWAVVSGGRGQRVLPAP